ncbi:MAG: hypothetical protein JWL93_735 [Hyphomicrobiales bacterium]|jgi:hypothetical protein|nr:hypothetical protein [Hyphomicrobiales bacterium]
MKARRQETDDAADLGTVGLFRLALFAMDQAHRQSHPKAARHFDEAALALAASAPDVCAYVSQSCGRMTRTGT